MGGVLLVTNYPFDVEEIHPIYLTETEARNRIEKRITELLAIFGDD